METPGYLMIKEAAVRYSVSRSKLHRLVKQGRLRTAKDPRDERVTLLRTDDIESVLRFPREEGRDMEYDTSASNTQETAGRLTSELIARMEALRERISGGRKLRGDSADIIREEREKRSRQVYEAAFGEGTYDETGDGQA